MTIALPRGARTYSVTALLAALAALVAVPDAGAHSILIATEPRRDTVVQDAPRRVLLRFNEGVDTSLGRALQVFDGNGERVGSETILRPSSREVAVEIDGEIADGTYTVAWRAISADSDPIRGAFVFHVGAPGANPEGVAADVSKDSPASLRVPYRGGRFLEFVLLILCAGGIAALVHALRSAEKRVHRGLCRVLGVSAAALAVVSVLGLAFQGAKASGGGLGEAFSWDNVSAVAGTRYGKVELARAGLALGLLVLVSVLRRSAGRTRRPVHAGAALLAAGLVVTPTLAGHATTAGALAVAADIAHVLAAAVWVGGLAFVVLALWLAREQRWLLAMQAVPRFSLMAVGSVGLLLCAGIVNAFLQVRTWRGLWETDYGLLLSAKVLLVLPLLALGAYNNRYAVPRLRAGVAQPGERRRFLRAAGAELVVMATIVGVTAFLVDVNPARHELEAQAAGTHGGGHRGGPTSTEVDFGPFRATVTVEPGTPGPNTIVMTLEQGPETPELAEVAFRASLIEPAIGPLEFEAEPAARRTRWEVEGADLPIAGDWKLRIDARVGEFDSYAETVSLRIGKDS